MAKGLWDVVKFKDPNNRILHWVIQVVPNYIIFKRRESFLSQKHAAIEARFERCYTAGFKNGGRSPNQEVQAGLRTWKKQGNGFSTKPQERNSALETPRF